ncbi:CpaF family protein [Ornithinimicrobium pekingense]|uniref:Type II secretion system protein E n=1 Tax=Ornithinimicrobium pekingense TaxID=384677 RepID=A0ABQ2F7M3_9MICO|nr:CpaF family protein [Ornithinimicrobium pekingense]GGK68677.1 type II secretion system protein E [Ornithinimicrobium pekingense]
MNLSERLRSARSREELPAAPTVLPSPQAPVASSQTVEPMSTVDLEVPTPTPVESDNAVAVPAPPPVRESDVVVRLKEEAREELFTRLGNRISDSALDEGKLQELVRREVTNLVNAASVPLKTDERRRLIKEITDDVLGYGPLQKLLDDDDVTEIMVNGPEKIYIESSGTLRRAEARFTSEDHLRRVIERIVSRVGRRIDESSPLVDARLEDGSRVNAVIPPLAFSGSTLTIRKFGKKPMRVEDLVARGSVSPQMVELLRACVEARLNILVSGGTGTGKTTMLNVLSSFIPDGERIVTIEDAVELQLQQEHIVRLESRPRNIEGHGEITIRDLVRNSLRMRPDRIIVGEVRGGESLDMLQAMNTGHDGSLSTLHANSPRDAISRLETMVLMAGMDLPLRAIREQIASAVDVIVQLTRLRDGTRRVTHVTEVQGMEGDIVTLQDAFVFDYSAGVDAQGRFLGTTKSTGVRPHFTERFEEQGIHVAPSIFETPEQPRGRFR